jgi:serine protease AprX
VTPRAIGLLLNVRLTDGPREPLTRSREQVTNVITATVTGHIMTARRGRPAVRRGAVSAVTVAAAAGVVMSGGVAHASTSSGLGYAATTDKGSLWNIAEVVGAHDFYRAGFTGKGVGVALIDTGVASVDGLTSGNVVDGADLSFDSQTGAAHVDGFGHGTHLASIIAGRDAVGTPASDLDPAKFVGIAPDSTLVDVKVGASNGAVDVSQVIAGIDWTVQHARDNGNNIRVITLAYGTDSLQSSSVDPLAFAVENAWKHGIVVVAAGGNDGDTTKTLADPASDPHVIAVGAMDDAGTVDTSDDTVPSWSTHGTTQRHVDVVAPGVSVLGLKVPGGLVDRQNPQAAVGSRFERGSGTSQAAAVVSGEVALMLDANPGLTPDQVKEILTGNAALPLGTSPKLGGAGKTDLKAVLKHALKLPPVPLTSTETWGTGTGSLEAARGDAHVVIGSTRVQGEYDVLGQSWNGSAWAKLAETHRAWQDGTWRGETLTGRNWQAAGAHQPKSWPTTAWSAPAGSVASSDAGWSAKTWRDEAWSAKTWRDEAWSAKTWRDESWGGA